jgi:OOP family OmpA-OmpF porin
VLALLAWSARAAGEDPRFHLEGGGAHAVTGQQQSEFGAGGVGIGVIELPILARVGVQASGGALVLAKGDAPKDAGVQPTKAGSAYFGTLGLRFRPFGRTKVAGPWIDANAGITQTGDLLRPVFDAHLGWDVRVAKDSRIDVGPFVGFTQIFQPSSDFRSADARILTAGISFSLGAKERAAPAGPAMPEKDLPPPPAFSPDQDKFAEAYEVCPDGTELEDGRCATIVRVFEDRILVDDIHFAFDSARIRDDSRHTVAKLAAFILEQHDLTDISIEGHADEVGTDEYNQRLSEARARTMKGLLVSFGVPKGRLRVVAFGKTHPKVQTARAELANRRVELFVTRTREEAGNGATSHAHGRSSR